ncbi:sulfate transporter [Paucibacter sp. KBW04]|uniref:DUF3164 family protein n=1 Tax=Paucibacter sp. KBW04 TaxID=2153361 RepID=UPI000F5881BF|nr:DUF3164 family protein [Paucibacter sp. KBW04]RQO63136.1 sulfate transporter [Paucibacter sp. KBW04]
MSEIKTDVPTGFMRDAQGRLVPESMVKPIDKLRDQTVRDLIGKALVINKALAEYKARAFADIAAMVITSAEQFEVKLGGDKGNVTLYSFDGEFKVVRQVQENIKFDERLKAAKALIDECITEWSDGSSDEIKVLINDAFQVNAEGDVNTNRVLGLRRLNIRAPKWLRAMDAIGESFSVVGSRSYVRLYRRVGDTDKYQAITLDLASV